MRIVVLIITSFLFSNIYADTSFSGYVKTDLRILPKSEAPIDDTYGEGFVEIKSNPDDNVDVVLSSKLRGYPHTQSTSPAHLTMPEYLYPTSVMLWEAYAELYDVGTEGLSLKVGKQRISWGKADKLNPTDNLNPYDLTNFFDFGSKIPTTAVNIKYYYSGDHYVNFIFMPEQGLSLMPRGEFSSLFDPTDSLQGQLSLYNIVLGQSLAGTPGAALLPSSFVLGDVTGTIETKRYSVENSTQAFRFGGTISSIDYSLSYLHSFHSLPYPKEVTYTETGANTSEFDVSMLYGLSEYQMLGFDLASELLKIGVWLEGAFFFPKTTNGTTGIINMDSATNLAVAVPSTASYPSTIVFYNDKMFFKYTVGFDYTFKWQSIYLNAQLTRGLMTEFGNGNLNHYVLIRVEKKLFSDKFKLSLSAGGLLTTSLDEKNGILLMPELEYLPYDAVKLVFGYIGAGGKGVDSANNPLLITSLSAFDLFYFTMKVNF